MSVIANLIEHSKKLGRISALIVVLGIAGTISILYVNQALEFATTLEQTKGVITDVLMPWLVLLTSIIGFYFAIQKKETE